ncbi:MAG: hypothetical protein ACPGTU_06635, partial [Myxococcota bacterium]
MIDAADEVSIDLDDPLCLSNTDTAGNPYPNADYYLEYFAFGCQYLVVDYDVDGDGLVGGAK